MPELRDRSLSVDLVSDGLAGPTSIAFLGPDDILVTEKNTGTVQRILNGEIFEEPLLDVNVNGEDERGLLGIAVSEYPPGNKPNILLYYTEAENQTGQGEEEGEEDENGDVEEITGDSGQPLGNRLYRYELSEDGTRLVNPELLLDLPYEPGPAHTGGAIAVGPDNHIYLAVGDLMPTSSGIDDYKFKVQNSENGEEPDGRAGIIRISQDGDVVNGKGILGDDHPLNMYYAYGIRNSFGIAFDPLTGNLWDTENGPSFGDEINLVEPGFNSGWAKRQGIWNVEGVIDEDGKRVATKGDIISANTSAGLTNFNGKGKYSSPELAWDQPLGPTAIAFLNSSKLGDQYGNDMFVGTVNDGLLNFDLDENRSGLILNGPLSDKVADTLEDTEDVTFAEGLGVISDVEVGPDGYLYIVSGPRSPDGKIYRVMPATTE